MSESPPYPMALSGSNLPAPREREDRRVSLEIDKAMVMSRGDDDSAR